MCTKEETRKIIREENPKWMRILLLAMVTGLGGWLLLSVHEHDAKIADIKEVIKEDIQTILIGQAGYSGQLRVLATEMQNLKDISIARRVDDYTTTEAKSRIRLEDERFNQLKSDWAGTHIAIEEIRRSLYELYNMSNHNIGPYDQSSAP